MNNRYDKLFSVLNIVFILVIVTGIIIGLDKIGILSVTDWFSGENKIHTVLPNDEGEIYKSLSQKKSSGNITVVPDLSEENVYALLADVEPSDNYYHEVTVTLFGLNNTKKTNRAFITKTDGKYDVIIYNQNSQMQKRIREIDDMISISNFNEAQNEYITIVEKGSFDIQSQTGVVITHNAFYETPENVLTQYSLAQSDLGSVLEITFTSTLENYSQIQKYWLSLDFGVVTRAECYEDNALVYLMETSVLE